MEEISRAYGPPKEIPTAKMMLYKNSKVVVRTFYDNIDFFKIAAGVLQEDTLTLYVNNLRQFYIMNVNIFNKRKLFSLRMTRIRKTHAEIRPIKTMEMI